jgi:hypothetical protein
MLSFLKEITQFYYGRGKLWLLPLVIVMVVLGALLLLGGGGSAFAPFIYAVF